MNKSFCVLPWVNISVDPAGHTRPCCISSDYIKKPCGSKFNLGYDTVEEIYNSQDYQELRRKMLSGEPISGCSECYELEKNGGYSNRIQFNKAWEQVDCSDVEVDAKLRYLDLRFGNLCNLNCRSCSPINSTQLEKEIVSLLPNGMDKFHVWEQTDYNSWYQTKTYTDNVDSQLDTIELLYLTGGEPTLIQQNFDLLQKLIAMGRSKEVNISINTNLTNTIPKFYDLLSNFKTVALYASIDGYGAMQEYLRYPSKWEAIDKNVKRCLDLGSNIRMIPTPVIQTANLGRIVELFDYFEDFNKQANATVVAMSPIILVNPVHLDFKYLPLEYKAKCWEQIESWMTTECKFQLSKFYNSMEAVKNKCTDDSYSLEQLNRYIEYNSLFDASRKQSLTDANPELSLLLESICKS